jgi:photosystem II stability/assembly factor-like uncharacterized protein
VFQSFGSLAMAAALASLPAFAVPSPSASARGARDGVVEVPSAFAALAFGMFDGGDVWAANGGGIWRTNDDGMHWSDITPSNLVGDDAAVRLTGFGWFGREDLWFSATEAGDVTKQGLRGFAIERSNDGGLAWHWTALPTCSGCAMSFSFVDAERGFALGGNGTLYSTCNGGASWSVVSTQLPRSSAPAIDFVNAKVGWLSSANLLERTTDAGRTWLHVALPLTTSAPLALSAPHFFSAADGFVVATLAGRKGVLYATEDGGSRWRAEPLPAAPNPPSLSPGWYSEPAFEVSSPDDWAMRAGPRLYVTGDAGQHWAEMPGPPTYGKGDPIWGFAVTSTATGWLAAAATPCGNGPKDLCAVPVLLLTTNHGKTWRVVPSNAQASPVGF